MLLPALSLALGHAHAETESHLSTPSTYEQLVSRAAEALKAPYSPSGADDFFENRKITPAFWSNIRSALSIRINAFEYQRADAGLSSTFFAL